MSSSKVAILRTRPATVLADYHRVMNLAGYRQVLDPAVETALKVNISWHFFYPASSTTPWQLEGVIRAMKQDGFEPNRLHACHNRTVVIDALRREFDLMWPGGESIGLGSEAVSAWQKCRR